MSRDLVTVGSKPSDIYAAQRIEELETEVKELESQISILSTTINQYVPAHNNLIAEVTRLREALLNPIEYWEYLKDKEECGSQDKCVACREFKDCSYGTLEDESAKEALAERTV